MDTAGSFLTKAVFLLAWVGLFLSNVGQGAATGVGVREECNPLYSKYFSHLTPDEIDLICHMMERIQIDDGRQQQQHPQLKQQQEQQLPGKQNSFPILAQIVSPQNYDLGEIIHVDNTRDEARQREELRQADRLEKMLTLRDKEEATKHEEEVGILRRIIQKYGKHQQGGLRGRFQSHGGHRSGDELGQDGQFLGSFVQGGGDIILKAQRF